MLKRIVILGPESTGKSTLCGQLAAHYNCLWVPEFAREYLLAHGPGYTTTDLLTIAQKQLAAEENTATRSAALNKEFLFIDTDMYVMKVWSEIVFNCCDNRILMQIAKRSYDLYLLCYPDIPWVKDELREYPSLEKRTEIYHYYKDALINQHVPWVEIKGLGEQRLEAAIRAVSKYTL